MYLKIETATETASVQFLRLLNGDIREEDDQLGS